MTLTFKAALWRAVGILAVVTAVNRIPIADAGQSAESSLATSASLSRATEGTTIEMSVPDENALVKQYCAVCHDNVSRNGGLSLEHFDASQVEPSLAAMMLSKLKTGALGASGQPIPDKPTQARFVAALSSESAGAMEWTLTRKQEEPAGGLVMTASIVRELPGTLELYRLKLTCEPEKHQAEIQLAWAPNPGTSGRTISVEVDTATPVKYRIEGSERMGNGMKRPDGMEVTSGPAATTLYSNPPLSDVPQLPIPLPTQELRIRELFANETVVFPFDGLTPTMRKDLGPCFPGTQLHH